MTATLRASLCDSARTTSLRHSAPYALALLLLAAASVAAQSVAGDWIVTVGSPDGATTIDVLFSFDQTGDMVTGSADLSEILQIEASEITDVTYHDGVLSFVLRIAPAGAEWITLEVEAEVDGDEMQGRAYVAELGQAQPFTARRTKTGGEPPP